MGYGEREMKPGDEGVDVAELQTRLAGFRGTVPDGQYGAGTQLQVTKFQEDFMGMRTASGVADRSTLAAIADFARQYPLDFAALRCPCRVCDGFGRGQFKAQYRPGAAKTEQNYLYEYPGIHRMLLWAMRAVFFYCRDYKFAITSGYRCSERNKQQGRTSTNHHGKAVDFDPVEPAAEDKREDMRRCDSIRGIIVEKSNAQIGWNAANRNRSSPPRSRRHGFTMTFGRMRRSISPMGTFAVPWWTSIHRKCLIKRVGNGL
jgi:hypothetical protein